LILQPLAVRPFQFMSFSALWISFMSVFWIQLLCKLSGLEGGKLRKVYMGSCRKLSRDDALQKAWEMKKEALGL